MPKTCFVVQGFGKKTDFQSGRTLDLDASYEVLKEAVAEAGLSCVRADEIPTSGSIDRIMYEQLLHADLVIADLSTSNVNAFYELGVRFALRPRATIVVAESKITFPFDVNHIKIQTYEHLGSDIGRREANRFKAELVKLIRALMSRESTDSPVFAYLPGLAIPAVESSQALPVASPSASLTLNELKRQAREAMDRSDFATALPLWQRVREEGPKDDYVVQQLALATYKSKRPSELEALEAAKKLLEYLWPHESLDPETLGLWAATNKRLYEMKGDLQALDEAITATERGFVLKRDFYNGINLAYLLDVRATRTAGAAYEDHAQARSVRRRVIAICTARLDAAKEMSKDDRYWLLATLREAAVGLGNDVDAAKWAAQAREVAAASWMVESTDSQIRKLGQMLAQLPAREPAGA